MTPKEVEDVVRRLEHDTAQLLRMADAAKFGEELSVRVKSPDLLIASMSEAASLLRTQAERIAELERRQSELARELSGTRRSYSSERAVNVATQATIERYREALEPFAKFDTGPDLDDGLFFLHDDHPLLGEGLGDDWKPAITVSHFRRARSVLEGKE